MCNLVEGEDRRKNERREKYWLTDKQKKFCYEYCVDLNGHRLLFAGIQKNRQQ